VAILNVAPEPIPVVVLVGPTAAGKTQAALQLRRSGWPIEVVSCDSLQVYRGLDIGSAKPSPEERAELPHHLLDVVDPDANFSAVQYAELARKALRDIVGRGAWPLVVGGAGLYLRALVQGLFQGPGRDESLRRRLEHLAERRGNAWLHGLLGRVDPEAARQRHPNDRLRIVRALEVYRLTRRRLTEHFTTPPLDHEFRFTVLGLAPERSELRGRVEARTQAMFDAGLVAETAAVLARHGGRAPRPLEAIGYRECLAVLAGRSSVAQAQKDVVTATMRYAKRQMTWFRHQIGVRWLPEPEALGRLAGPCWRGSPGTPGLGPSA